MRVIIIIIYMKLNQFNLVVFVAVAEVVVVVVRDQRNKFLHDLLERLH